MGWEGKEGGCLAIDGKGMWGGGGGMGSVGCWCCGCFSRMEICLAAAARRSRHVPMFGIKAAVTGRCAMLVGHRGVRPCRRQDVSVCNAHSTAQHPLAGGPDLCRTQALDLRSSWSCRVVVSACG